MEYGCKVMKKNIVKFFILVFFIIPIHAQQRAVDLGLSVKWGAYNLGAKTPIGFGNYYSWGEVHTKSSFTWENYRWGTSNAGVKKYNFTDGRMRLEKADDAANVALGGSWRIPTIEEWKELMRGCNKIWTKERGIKGVKFISKKNGNSIFLPAGGFRFLTEMRGPDCGYYRSSDRVDGYEMNSSVMWFCCDGKKEYIQITSDNRYEGYSIRPVSK